MTPQWLRPPLRNRASSIHTYERTLSVSLFVFDRDGGGRGVGDLVTGVGGGFGTGFGGAWLGGGLGLGPGDGLGLGLGEGLGLGLGLGEGLGLGLGGGRRLGLGGGLGLGYNSVWLTASSVVVFLADMMAASGFSCPVYRFI